MSIEPSFARQHLAGFNVVDCDVRARDFFYFLARRDYTQDDGWRDSKSPPAEGRLEKRSISLNLANGDSKRWGSAHLRGLGRPMCGMAFAPEIRIVVMDGESSAWVKHPTTNGFEAPIKSQFEGGDRRGGIMRVRSFGAEAFCCTNGRDLFFRVEPGNWKRVGPLVPALDGAGLSDEGFEDFDRFSETAWYAAGGLSDVWHFDGTDWRQCAFPTNQGIFAVCCAGDGEVYLSVGAGSIYRGKGDRWKRIHEGQMSIPIKDLVWYEGQVWGTSDYGLWTITDGVFAEADVPPAVKICSGNLATRDGVLLVAGYGGAAFKRDGQWTVIFHDHELRQTGSRHT